LVLTRISVVPVLAIALLIAAAIGCNSPSEPTLESEPDALVLFAASSDIGLGTARIPLNIQLIDGTRYDNRASELEVLYTPPDSEQALVADDLKWRAWPIRSGIYTTVMTFDRVGVWKIKVRSTTNENMIPAGGAILVKSATGAPNIGDPAPLSTTKTAPADGNFRSITSAPEPDPDLYAISFDDAVATGKPTVISFSTPAYCQSKTCGPQTQILSELDDKYSGRANFIHVEIFDNPEEMRASGDPSLGIEAAVIHKWEFSTEPWTFVVDGNGIVVGRFESFVTSEEIEEYLLPVLSGT
tara:strand:- start:6278 stop:7174 length:897 start_codon:yes stop_codon:yes gene_type:complete